MAPCLLLLLLGACGDKGPDLQPLAEDDVILAFGDSLTWGTGAKRDQSYARVLARLSGHEVVNAGVPGELSAQGLARLPGVLDEYRPALVILIHGGNDLLRKYPRAEIKNHLAAMVEVIRRHGAQVVLAAVPRPALLLSADPLYAELAQTEKIPLEETALAEILQSRASKSDAIHPNAAGYAQLARAIYRFLQDRQAL